MKSNADRQAEIENRDLTRAAFHEVSHAVISRHFGGFPEASIWRNLGYAERNEVAWAGTCQSYTPNMTSEHRKLVGLAGFIGEQLVVSKADGEPIEEFEGFIADHLFMAIDDGELSASDMADIGVEPSCNDVEAVLKLLEKYWSEVEREALEMIGNAKMLQPKEENVIFSSVKRSIPITKNTTDAEAMAAFNEFFGFDDLK